MSITKEEFEQAYAVLSGVTVAWLKAQGQEARPCDCEDETCQGWQMSSRGGVLTLKGE